MKKFILFIIIISLAILTLGAVIIYQKYYLSETPLSFVMTTYHDETHYKNPTFSPDNSSVAYIKNQISYTSIKPYISLFIGEETKKTEITAYKLSLCINNLSGDQEKCINIKEMPAPSLAGGDEVWQKSEYTWPQITSKLYWDDKNSIKYGVAITDSTHGDIFFSGVLQTDPQNMKEEKLSDNYKQFEELHLSQDTPPASQKLRLVSLNDNFDSRVLYIVDRENKQVAIYITDPSLKNFTIPKYATFDHFQDQFGWDDFIR